MVYKNRKKRGYCACGKRTSITENCVYVCKDCGNMVKRLTDKLGGEEGISKNDAQLLKIIKKGNLSPKELQTLVRGSKNTKRTNPYKHYANSDHYKMGVFSDAHIGQENFDEKLFAYMGDKFREEEVEAVYQVGDILEGMSGRDGQIYELKEVGFSAQINKAEQLFKDHLYDLDVYGITGNHDLWFQNKGNMGINVGEELDNRVENYTHLGDMEADVKLAPNVSMKLFHPGDGSAYAISYKLQKLMESFTGGEKPNIVLEGHYHKALYFFNRNIHGVECGTICGQTGWMRGKKLPAHKGFWVIDVGLNKKGVTSFAPTFYPSYD